MKVSWEVDDGYIGSRPQTTTVPDAEIRDCETKEEARKLIEEYISEDFQQTISWGLKNIKELDENLKDMFPATVG